MAYSVDTLKELAILGVNLELIEGSYSADSLKDLARLVASREAMLTIHVKGLSAGSLKEIAIIGRKHITFRL
jgi:hypothetical protein